MDGDAYSAQDRADFSYSDAVTPSFETSYGYSSGVSESYQTDTNQAYAPNDIVYSAPEMDYTPYPAPESVPQEIPQTVYEPQEVTYAGAAEPEAALNYTPEPVPTYDVVVDVDPVQEGSAEDPAIVYQQSEDVVFGEQENEESYADIEQGDEVTYQQQLLDTDIVPQQNQEDVYYDQENDKAYVDPERLSQQSEEYFDGVQTDERAGADPAIVVQDIPEARQVDRESNQVLDVVEPAKDSDPEPAPRDAGVAAVSLKVDDSAELLSIAYPGDDVIKGERSFETDPAASVQEVTTKSSDDVAKLSRADAPPADVVEVAGNAKADAPPKDALVKVSPVEPAVAVAKAVVQKKETALVPLVGPPEKVKKPVYKFQVVWDPVRTTEDMGNDIRNHIIMSPYRGESRAAVQIYKADLPEGDPLRVAVDACRERGIPIVTGCWKYWNNPIAILFDLDHMPQHIIDRYCAELNRDHQIDIPHNEDKARRSIVLGYSAVELIIQFEIAIGRENLSKKSWIRFHNWTAASGAIFLPQWWPDPRTKIALLISRPQLEDLLPTHPIDAKNMAREARVSHRYALELAAAKYASQIVVPPKFEQKVVEKQLFREPTHRVKDPVPNWFLRIKQFFTGRRYKQLDRMREVMISDESEADNDLQQVAVPPEAQN